MTFQTLCTPFFYRRSLDSFYLNSSLSAAYMRQWIESALVQIMACRLFGAKPLPEPMLAYCQLDPWEQNFSFMKIHLRISSVKFQPFCHGLNVLTKSTAVTNVEQRWSNSEFAKTSEHSFSQWVSCRVSSIKKTKTKTKLRYDWSLLCSGINKMISIISLMIVVELTEKSHALIVVCLYIYIYIYIYIYMI